MIVKFETNYVKQETLTQKKSRNTNRYNCQIDFDCRMKFNENLLHTWLSYMRNAKKIQNTL